MEAKYNEWEFNPIHLNADEIANPLKIIDDFFSDDSLNGHLERLTQWRDYVLKDDYYRDYKGTPAGLLYFHKLSLRLVESASLILKVLPIEDGNIETELLNVLKQLNETERLDLYAVLSSFFASYNLPAYRAHLYEWLENALSKQSGDGFIRSKDLIGVYENMQRLYQAAWMICLHIPDGPSRLYEKVKVETEVKREIRLHELNPEITEQFAEPIKQVVSIIKEKIPTVQFIFYLGASPAMPDKLYLMIFTGDDEVRTTENLAATVMESCSPVIAVFPVVLQVSKLFSGISEGKRFFDWIQRRPIIYHSGQGFLPSIKMVKSSSTVAKAEFNWNRWYGQGKDFLSGAEFYKKNKAYGAALFSLHQCAECLLTAIIKAVLDYNIGGHNLSKLLQMTMMFTDDIASVFDLENEQKAKQFHVLKDAYVNVRYKDNYEPEASYIDSLYRDIKELCIRIEMVYQKHIASNCL